MAEEITPERREYLESVVRLRNIENQVANIQNQLKTYEVALVELITTKEALESLEKQKKDETSLLPFGSGVFVDGILKKQNKILIDVGAGVLLEKTVLEALDILKKREGNLRKNMVDFQNILSNLEKTYLKTSQRIQELEKKV